MRTRVLLLLAAVPLPLPGQEVLPAGELSLGHVVEAALARSPDLALAEQQLTAGAGALRAARGGFATRLSTSLIRDQATEPTLGADGAVGARPTVTSGTYQLALTRRLRSGLLLQPQLSVSRSDVQAAGPLATNSASVGLQMVLPLWRDRGAAQLRASEGAAASGYEADRLSLRHVASAGVLEVVAAYWDYVAARQRERVYALSEERARRLADETRLLVAADERPAADLNQLLANVASKRMTRISAEQVLLQARRRLGLSMGLGPIELWELGDPADPFPEPRPLALDSAAERRLVESALGRRPDLAAARRRREAAEALLHGARSGLKPQLDLAVSLGYTGIGTGSGLERWVQPLYRDLPGLNSTVQLQYGIPVRNDEAEGRAMQHSAAVEQQRIRERELRSEIATGIRVALQALERSVRSAAEADAAVHMYREAVDNEVQKHRLDAATLFDVILAEDALTGAMLGQVSARLGYALAVASLRFETSSLLDWVDGRPSARTEDLFHMAPEPAR